MKEIECTIAKSDGPMNSTYVTEGGTFADLFCHPVLAESVLARIDDKDYSIQPIDDVLAWMISLQQKGVKFVQQYLAMELSGAPMTNVLVLEDHIATLMLLREVHRNSG